MSGTANLSDSRGGGLGIALLRMMLNVLGVNFTARFIWCISLFYVLFDKQGRERASWYLARRFPEDGPLRRLRHTWALFTSQGQSLLEAAAIRADKVELNCSGLEEFRKLIADNRGAICLCSHFGQWQGMMRVVRPYKRKAWILARPDRNLNVNKFMAVNDLENRIGFISTESPMGGLLDVYDALVDGGIVCMMGDRCLENEAVRVPFLGAEAKFPVAAFRIAARANAPVVPLFAYRENGHRSVRVRFMPPILPQPGRSRDFTAPLRRYTAMLEQMAQEHPFECYLFENIWSQDEKN